MEYLAKVDFQIHSLEAVSVLDPDFTNFRDTAFDSVQSAENVLKEAEDFRNFTDISITESKIDEVDKKLASKTRVVNRFTQTFTESSDNLAIKYGKRIFDLRQSLNSDLQELQEIAENYQLPEETEKRLKSKIETERQTEIKSTEHGRESALNQLEKIFDTQYEKLLDVYNNLEKRKLKLIDELNKAVESRKVYN